MNQVEKNSIGGYAFTLETTAAEKIDKYLGELKEFYSGIESGNEIMEASRREWLNFWWRNAERTGL